MIRFAILLLVTTAAPGQLAAQDELTKWLRIADSAETAGNNGLAYQQYQQVLTKLPNHLTAMCKASLLADKLGNASTGKTERSKYFAVANNLAKKAVQAYPNSADAHFSMAVALGRVAETGSGKEIIEAVKKMKVHADKAIAINPNDYRPYHVLGRWHYEVSALGGMKRAAVKVLYGAFPDASFQQAAKAYEKSMQFNPKFQLNYLELAKVYQELKQEEKAVAALQKMLNMPPQSAEDKRHQEQARNWLKKLRS